MKLAFWYSGNPHPHTIASAMEPFEKRIQRYIKLEQQHIELPKGQTGEQRAMKERDKVLKRLKQGDRLVLLDETGQQFDSKALANYLDQQLQKAHQRLIFLSGGSHGFHDDLHQRADDKVALSKLTLNHAHARLVFIEQLYRCLTIIHNDPYHH